MLLHNIRIYYFHIAVRTEPLLENQISFYSVIEIINVFGLVPVNIFFYISLEEKISGDILASNTPTIFP